MSTSTEPQIGVLEADIRAQAFSYAQVVRSGPLVWDPAIEPLLRSSFDRVVLSGMGSSFFAALAGAGWLSSGGVPATARLASELLHQEEGVGPGDLVVVVSQSGASVETLGILDRSKEAGAATLAVVRDPRSPAGSTADGVMLLGVEPDHGVAIKTFGASLLALSYLSSALAKDTPSWITAAHAAIDAVAGVPGDSARRVGAEISTGASAMVALARGPLAPAAREGALLVNEVAKMPAWWEDPGQFRHGMIELAGPDIVTWLPVSPDRDVEQQVGQAVELRETGAGVVATCPPALTDRLEGAGAKVIEVPHLSPPFEMLLHVAAFQWVGLGWAEALGVEPGRFRHAQQVVRFEAGTARTQDAPA